MRRSLQRSRLPAILAIGLTMSLVIAFGMPVAVADTNEGGKANEQGCESRAEAHSDQTDQREDCNDGGSVGRGNSDDDSRGENSPEARPGADNSSQSKPERSNSESSSSTKSSNQSRQHASNSNNANGEPDNKSGSQANSSNQSKSNSKGNTEARSNDKSNAKSNDKGDASKGDASKGNSKGNKGNTPKAKRDNDGKNDSTPERRSRGKGRNERADRTDDRPETHPPGNNGTVKIDGVAFDDHPNNEPHPGCTFQVDFYNYDEGQLFATVTFRTHPPTQPSGQVVLTESGIFIGEDGAGGGTDLDASRTFTLDLSTYEPHDQQGHHIKLTVNADGSQGADTKHKVFWVDCLAEGSPPADEDGDLIEDEDLVEDGDLPNDEDVIEDIEVDRDELVGEDQDTSDVDLAGDLVRGLSVRRGAAEDVAISQAAPSQASPEIAAQQEEQGAGALPTTGAGVMPLIALALALVSAGSAFLRRRSPR